jgi:hypothetical protein
MHGCCQKVEVERFSDSFTAPGDDNTHLYKINLVYCKNCGSVKSASAINHVKNKNGL